MIKKFFRDHPVHKKIVPWFDNLFILRPTLFFPVWIMITVGMAAAKMNIDRYEIWIVDISLETILLFLGITLISGSAFIINQIKDKDGDEVNEKLFLVGNYVSVELANRIMTGVLVAGFIALLVSGWVVFLCGIILYLFWGILYNYRPFHWKKKPLLGMFANTVAGFSIYLSGWLHTYISRGFTLTDGLTMSLVYFSIPYILCYTAVSMLTTIPDIKGDKETGAETFPIRFGLTATLLLAAVFVAAAFVLGYKLGDPVSSTAALVSLPFYLVALFKRNTREVLRTIRYSLFILAVFVIAVYPWLFPAVLITFYLSKYYYWHRFNLHYPTFNVDNQAA